jgi:glucuronate isomerase
MRPFIHEDFLLHSDVARDLYHRVARDLPIVDYHCHLPVAEIATNHAFRSITEIWLDGDHDKWRAMRTSGVPERFCAGDASDWEKFEAWARTVPYTLRNPLEDWTHMELARPFGIHELLSEKTARSIFDRCNDRLRDPAFSTQGLLCQFTVAIVCTTDDPADSLDHHHALAAQSDPDTVSTRRGGRTGRSGSTTLWRLRRGSNGWKRPRAQRLRPSTSFSRRSTSGTRRFTRRAAAPRTTVSSRCTPSRGPTRR